MSDAQSVAIGWLEAWTEGNFESARQFLHSNMTFEGPLGSAQGADSYVSGLHRFEQIGVRSCVIHKVFVDGDDVCLVYELLAETAVGTVRCAAWYQVREGKIASVRAFFDSRVLV